MPRKIIGGAFLSMDGVMQAPGGPTEDPTGGFAHGGWLTGLFDEGLGNQVDTLFGGSFDLLLGRRTYEIFAAHWPLFADDGGIGTKFAAVRKYVVAGPGLDLGWTGSHRLDGIDAVAALRKGDGPNLVIQGSSTLYPQLLQAGLLDRLVTMTAPIVLGTGKRLFGEGTPAARFKLIEQRTTENGVVMSTYEPAGKIEIGSFAAPDPSPAELERRRKIEAGTW